MIMKVMDQTGSPTSRRRLSYLAAAIIIVLISVAYFYSAFLTGSTQPKAAIIDQLSSSRLSENIRYENQTFVNTAKELLHKRFSNVDYYSDNATVEEYRQLASANYKLIVWRAHTALDLNSKYVAISTTDKYGFIDYDEYLDKDQLTLCNITGDSSLYFGITPEFVDHTMSGKFQDTVIVLMSCNGLKQNYTKTADALEQKGAKVLISWDGWISSSDNDRTVSFLLQHLISENETVSMAISGSGGVYFSELYGWARLQYNPQASEVANYRIPDYVEDANANATATMVTTYSRQDQKTVEKLF